MASDFDDGFRKPSDDMKPWCYWYWLEGDISKAGISKDLESMAKVGIKRAMIGNISLEGETGPIEMMSPQWIDMTRHAFSEAKRTGVELYMFNGPGWSQSGGPWIRQEQSMRRITWNETVAEGGVFSGQMRPSNVSPSQDIAVLALPVLESVTIKGVKKSRTYVFSSSKPFTARALLIDGIANGHLYALLNGKRKLVTKIEADRGNPKTDFLVGGLQPFSFAGVKSKEFEFVMTPSSAKRRRQKSDPWDNESMSVILSSEPKIHKVFHKQMGRMHPTPAPTWESYIFKDTVEPEDNSLVVKRRDILDLSHELKDDGSLSCVLPAGKWEIIYFGMVPTGKLNHPAPPEAKGLEVDKMSKKHTRHHFESQFAKLMDAMTPEEKSVFKGITIDSYEVGAQNWTDGFDEEFQRRNGYDPIAFLPVMTGRVIDSAKASERFLWDLRRNVSDMIAENYVGTLRQCAHEKGLVLWCENYGHWGFPGDFLIYGAYADELGGEFWVTPEDRGTIECRAASSAAHIYGKRRVFAEAFTNRLDLSDHPYKFKSRGEALFCEGINHFVLHVYVHQPLDGSPGTNPWFGTPFHRNTPWFNGSQAWIEYLQRCHYMLQQGESAADVAVYIGDFAPQMTGPANPVPFGYDYDYIGSDAISRTLHVVDGEWVIYDENDPNRIASRYKVLSLPEIKTIRPHIQERIDALIDQGGRVVRGVPLTASKLERSGIPPALSQPSCPVLWKARRLENNEDLFFLSNFDKTGPFQVTCRVGKKVPYLYHPVTGEIHAMARYDMTEHGVRVALNVEDESDSFFIVFREASTRPSVVDVSGEWVDVCFGSSGELIAESKVAQEVSVTMSNGQTRTLSFDTQSHEIHPTWEKTRMGQSTCHFDTSFSLPVSYMNKEKIELDLGDVDGMVKVTLNGNPYPTLWMQPFSLDISDAVKTGDNFLTIHVTSASGDSPAVGVLKLEASNSIRFQ